MGGSKSKPPAPPQPVDPVAQANANVQAQIQALPQAAQVQFDILQNPEFGLLAQTQLGSDVREQVFGGEADVKNQLIENVLAQLQSPTALTQEQQAAIDSRRRVATGGVQEALRNRANLGGGLFGGRAQATEQRAVQDLMNQFVEEDVTRQERNRLNNQQTALAISQVLFPNIGLQQPQFINPVVSADTQFGGAVNQSNALLDSQTRQFEADRALRSSLFQGLGTAAGGIAGGIGAANAPAPVTNIF
jgi:hypothetical protein